MDASRYQLIRERCAFAHLRRATRVITLLFDEAYRSSGLRSTQCSLLLNIFLAGNISVGALGELLRMDQTTVTRSLKLLEDQGYICSVREEGDARKKSITITELGKAKLGIAMANWDRIQIRIEREIGAERFQELLKTLRQLESFMD